MSGQRSRSWIGLACSVCEYGVFSPDTRDGVPELMWLHMTTAHPEVRWMDSDGRIHGGKVT